MADNENDVYLNTEPAIQALNELQEEFTETFDRVTTDVDGAARAMSDFEREVARARGKLNSLDGGASGATDAVVDLGKETAKSNRAIAGAVNEVTELGYSITAAIPGTGQLASSIGAAGNSAYQLGIKLGPVGVAIGLLANIGLPLLAKELFGASEETEELAKRQEKLQEQMDETRRSALALASVMLGAADQQLDEQISKQVELRNQAEIKRYELAARRLELEEQLAEMESRQTAQPTGVIDQQLQAAATLNNELTVGEQLRRDALRQELRANQEAIDQADFRIEQSREVESALRDRRDATEAEANALELNQRAVDALTRSERELQKAKEDNAEAARNAALDKIEDLAQSAIYAQQDKEEAEERAARLREIHAEDIRRGNELARRREEEHEANTRMLREAIELQRELTEARDEAKRKTEEAGQITADYLSQGIALVQKMQEINAKQQAGEISAYQARKQRQAAFLKEFSQQMILKGLEQIALVPASYSDFPKMAAHGVAAGLFFGAAAAAGGGARKAAAAGAPKGGSAPRASGRDSGGGGGGQNVSIQINNPLTSTVDQGREVDRALTAQSRRLGGSGRR